MAKLGGAMKCYMCGRDQRLHHITLTSTGIEICLECERMVVNYINTMRVGYGVVTDVVEKCREGL